MNAGHFVLVDPRDRQEDRLKLVEMMAANGAFDALFFRDLDEARVTIDAYIEAGLFRPPR